MEKRIVAALIAMLVGGAYAQSNTSSPSNAPRVGNPPVPNSGYVGSGAGVMTTSPFGLCWRSGAEWDPSKAALPCDSVPTAGAYVPPPVAAAPQPEPAPAPAPQAAAPAPEPVVIEKVTLSTDVLFEFDKAELRDAGKQKLDELAAKAQDANIDKVVLIGHADRIGTEQYNQDLSDRRAKAVGDYLASKGVDRNRLQVEARGESQPVTGNECNKLGPENNKNAKLIACLQPDRRVEAEFLGSRETTASRASPAAVGGTSGAKPSESGAAGGSSSESGTKSED